MTKVSRVLQVGAYNNTPNSWHISSASQLPPTQTLCVNAVARLLQASARRPFWLLLLAKGIRLTALAPGACQPLAGVAAVKVTR